jgi:hypothetical protein
VPSPVGIQEAEKSGVVMPWKNVMAIIDMGIMEEEESPDMAMPVDVGMVLDMTMDMGMADAAVAIVIPDISMLAERWRY